MGGGGGNSFPPGHIFWGRGFFLERGVFVHSHTAVQKRPSGASEKMYTYIFQAPRTENRAKKGRFYGFSPFWACFEGFPSKPLKINVSRLRKWRPLLDSQEYGTLRVFFDHSDPRDFKTTLGVNGEVGLSVGGSFLKKSPKSPKKG